MSYFQGDEPSNEFVEFVRVGKPGLMDFSPEAIILYESSTRAFTVQVGYKVGEYEVSSGKRLVIVTTTGSVVGIERKKRGNIGQRYRVLTGDGYVLRATRTDLSS